VKFYIYLIKQPGFTTPVVVSTFYFPQDRLELTVYFFCYNCTSLQVAIELPNWGKERLFLWVQYRLQTCFLLKKGLKN